MSYQTTAVLENGLEQVRPGVTLERLEPLAGDASARTFQRLHLSDGSRLVAMSTPPPPLGDGGAEFQTVGRHLAGAGVAVPVILYSDVKVGLALVEDLGNDLLENHARADAPKRSQHYRAALTELVRIQHQARRHPGLSPALNRSFDRATFFRELKFFAEHTVDGLLRLPLTETTRTALSSAFEDIAERLASFSPVLCHRDYHSRNLLVHRGRVRVIDYQDARLGPAAYDLASLLHDPYAELEPTFRATLIADYTALSAEAGVPIEDQSAFEEELAVATVQRCLKAAGTYGYQVVHRKRHHYRRALGPALSSVREQLPHIPEHHETLSELLDGCAERGV